ncbi:MerR family transcriptional regulator [Gracilibacillus oryzae]|uniref:MerR family transcriptional regulator n=1 Tax=Gracilibacillus oryzae TaxID=1672701 RepID=A0A7C8GR67_9BACI|nr:MerR family transcriptional regulator [Gracilibacillus oryzae]KAB8127662.1 MerR family transcriptional regulator [Gracilibacillus oryzae]
MEYTVSQLAKLSGVSGRTLRYYDQIGLLKPAYVNDSGYRIYGEKETDLLQQILFFRELEISLEDINKIINQPDFDQTEALRNHYDELQKKRDRLDSIISTVAKTLAAREGGMEMSNKDKFDAFKEKLIEENEQKYGEEIREKYGDKTINESNAKLRGMSEEDFEVMNKLEGEIITLLEKSYKTGDPASDLAQELAHKHKEWLMYSWPSYSEEAHAGLVDMFVADERYTAYYDKHVKGGTAFLRDAVLNYLDKK